MVYEGHRGVKREFVQDPLPQIEPQVRLVADLAGVHMRVIQELLGHSDFYLTMNTYSHVIPEQKREAAEKMDALLSS